MRGDLLLPSSNGATPRLRFGTGAGPTLITSGYDWATAYSASNAFQGNAGGAGQANIAVSTGVANTKPGLSFEFAIHTDHASWIRVNGTATLKAGDGNFYGMRLAGGVATSVPITAMEWSISTGNLTSGSVSLYGVVQ
jgi:hypothetical protein